ncbi:BON domain-containing protein [Mesorhizobium silamurunense]|uniref:BON domain-containing protein n=1 Tax=Mesorhizobium silamurunense TaxID=499528 RepID=UPI00177ECD89|nr:BON domain-containing protein [Mesorhizobium silamurunense]
MVSALRQQYGARGGLFKVALHPCDGRHDQKSGHRFVEHPIDEIAALLDVNRTRRVFVVNSERVVGVVARADLVRALASVRKSLPRPVSFHDDASIRREIVSALRSEAWPSIGEADVMVTNGVVALWGGYMSEQERKASLVLAENTAGVRAVDDHRVPLDIAYAMV